MSQRSKIIRVQVEHDRVGLLYATSPDLKGLLVGRPNMESLFEAIPEAIRNLYAAKGEDVVVTFAKDNSEFYPWVAIPAEVAAQFAHS